MAPPTSSPKIEELRFRLKTDPKSRLFFPLAEELRKISQLAEAEQVLRTGLMSHPTYLSAWVSLGRVARDLNKHHDAIEALNKALTLDPGNMVAARLLGDAFVGLGEHVEAIKKYKLVRALVPGDEELDTIIENLEVQIKAGAASPAPEMAAPEPVPATSGGQAPSPVPTSEAPVLHSDTPGIVPPDVPVAATPAAFAFEEVPPPAFVNAPTERESREEIATADVEPMRLAHTDSPFEAPAAELGYSADAFELENPPGMHIEAAPPAAELPIPTREEEPYESQPVSMSSESDADDVFAPSVEPSFASHAPPPPPDADDFAKTITMADLYAQQGLIDEARDIYEDVLLRDPSNHSVRAKLEALDEPVEAAVDEYAPEEPEPEQPVEAGAPWLSAPPHVAPASAGESSPFETPFEAPAPFAASAEEVPIEEPVEPPFDMTSDAPVFEPSMEAPLAASARQSGGRDPKIGKLESWLSKVSR